MTEDAWPPDQVPPVAVAGAPPALAPPRMRYLDTYRFVFRGPRWGMNLLFGSVCQLVPGVGPVVFLGYGYEVVEEIQKWGDRRCPDFDVNRLLPYLMRGIWPFLVGLIVGLPLAFVVGPAVLVMMIALVTSRDPGPVLAVAGGVCAGLVVLSVIVQVMVAPLLLRAGLSQELGLRGGWAFARGFLARAWKELLLGELFLMFTGVFVVFAGLALCLVGVYPAGALLALAHHHMLYQAYRVYLARGGVPIPLKEDRDGRGP